MQRYMRCSGLLAAVLSGAVSLPAAAQSAPRSGYDPLSTDEIAQAQSIAAADSRVAALLTQTKHSELLFVERHDEGKSSAVVTAPPRRADVYYYLYDSDRLVSAVSNLQRKLVDSLGTTQNVQLPPNANEDARALNLALSDAAAGKAIRQEYQNVTGTALSSASQLQYKSLVFRADAHPSAATATGASSCGLHRCAQLLLMTAGNGTLVNVMPIVDLSAGTVPGTVPFVQP